MPTPNKPRSIAVKTLSEPPKQLTLLVIDNPERRRWELERDDLMNNAEKATNTEVAYSSGWRSFTKWCLANKYKPLPASFDAVSQFVRHLINEENLRLSTVRVKLSAIQHYHVADGQPDPVDARIRKMLSNAARKRKERAHHKEPVMADQVLAVLAANDGSGPKSVRDRALFLLLFATGWRRSELRSLDADDISSNAEGIILSLGASKADQVGKGREVSVPYDEEPAHCPVRHLEAWVKARGSAPGPLFCPVAKGGDIRREGRLGGRAICTIVQDMLKRSGVKDFGKYGAHSLRSGMITAAHLNGANEKDIMHSTGHKSILTMWRYIRPLAGFKRYPLRGVLARAKSRKATA